MLKLQPHELSAFTQAEPGAQLLDVREGWELQLCQIRLADTQALHIPMQDVPARLHEIDETRPVVCICHHGVRSAQVVAFLQHQGLVRVYNLTGGIDAWSTQVDPSLPRY